MNISIKSILNAVLIVWVITQFLNVGPFALPVEDVFQIYPLPLDHLLKSLLATTGKPGLQPTIAASHD